MFLLLTCFLLKSAVSFLNENELQIALELSKEFNPDGCILVGKETYKKDLITSVKKFSSLKVSSSFLNYKELANFVSDNRYNETLLLILEGNNLNEAKFLESLKTMEVRHKMCQYMWIIYVEEKPPINYLNPDFTIPYDCEYIVVQPGEEASYKLTEVYNVEENTFHLHYGIWDPKNGLQVENTFFLLRRQNLNKTRILLASIDDSEKYKEAPADRQLQEIIYELSDLMNMQLEKFHNETAGFIEVERNFLINRALYLTFHFDERENTFPIFKMNINWYMKYPKTKLRSDFYLQPFEKKFWLVVIFLIITGSIFVTMVQELAPEKENRSLIDNMFLGIEYFCNLSGNDEIKNASLRLASFSLRLVYITVMASFGAVVTSYLAVEIPETDFVDLKTFFQNGEYDYAVDDDQTLVALFSFYPDVEELFSGNYIPIDKEEHFERICNEKIIFIDVSDKIFRKNITCEIYQIKKSLGEIFLVIELLTYRPFRKAFNYNVLRFFENGLQARKRDKIMVHNGNRKIKDDELQSVEFEQMKQILSVPFIGAMLATMIVIGERFYKKVIHETRWTFSLPDTSFLKIMRYLKRKNLEDFP